MLGLYPIGKAYSGQERLMEAPVYLTSNSRSQASLLKLGFSRKQNRFMSNYFQKSNILNVYLYLRRKKTSMSTHKCSQTEGRIVTSKLTWQPVAAFVDIWLPLCGCTHFPLTSDVADKLIDMLLTSYKCSSRKHHQWLPYRLFKRGARPEIPGLQPGHGLPRLQLSRTAD